MTDKNFFDHKLLDLEEVIEYYENNINNQDNIYLELNNRQMTMWLKELRRHRKNYEEIMKRYKYEIQNIQ